MKGLKAVMAMGAAAAVLAACGPGAGGTPAASARPRTFSVPIYDAQGAEVGNATFTQMGRDSVRLVANATRVPAGQHGIHLHAVGRCEGPGFQTAGGHLNPTNRQHGLRNPQGPHLGDMPNLTVAAGGTGRSEWTFAGSLTPGTPPVFDADGTALVIHAAADDQVTDPAGNSGARIACAVIAAPTAG
ncbi:MAG TPA: superoxide dismutase family protein [Longimicrobium sp.]|nr:superoxide dismutase family protein [Longimicrobium sp.]